MSVDVEILIFYESRFFFAILSSGAAAPEKPVRESAEEAPAAPEKPVEPVQADIPVDVAQAEVAKPVQNVPEEISDNEETSAQAIKKKKKKNKFCRCC